MHLEGGRGAVRTTQYKARKRMHSMQSIRLSPQVVCDSASNRTPLPRADRALIVQVDALSRVLGEKKTSLRNNVVGVDVERNRKAVKIFPITLREGNAILKERDIKILERSCPTTQLDNRTAKKRISYHRVDGQRWPWTLETLECQCVIDLLGKNRIFYRGRSGLMERESDLPELLFTGRNATAKTAANLATAWLCHR
ncbi:hypothetical protein EVAR_59427_1 [Eumeta japonica]|uniref:Uncharacterized protein n=1 Tax=Eumeta variegata TaxID=151549 RepID=A0A4C1ZRH4_EUMVA|nr:hypothetical protein EVAR_59427_1 [Eumeta japonica]